MVKKLLNESSNVITQGSFGESSLDLHSGGGGGGGGGLCQNFLGLEKLHSFFKQLIPPRELTFLMCSNIGVSLLDSYVTRDEILISLNKCKIGKSLGTDGTCNESS